MMSARPRSECDPRTAELTPADRLFLNLDHRRITSESGSATVEILGIHVMPDRSSWIQLAIVGDPRQAVVLHMPQSSALDDAIAALDGWGATPVAERPRSIDLTPVV